MELKYKTHNSKIALLVSKKISTKRFRKEITIERGHC